MATLLSWMDIISYYRTMSVIAEELYMVQGISCPWKTSLPLMHGGKYWGDQSLHADEEVSFLLYKYKMFSMRKVDFNHVNFKDIAYIFCNLRELGTLIRWRAYSYHASDVVCVKGCG